MREVAKVFLELHDLRMEVRQQCQQRKEQHPSGTDPAALDSRFISVIQNLDGIFEELLPRVESASNSVSNTRGNSITESSSNPLTISRPPPSESEVGASTPNSAAARNPVFGRSSTRTKFTDGVHNNANEVVRQKHSGGHDNQENQQPLAIPGKMACQKKPLEEQVSYLGEYLKGRGETPTPVNVGSSITSNLKSASSGALNSTSISNTVTVPVVDSFSNSHLSQEDPSARLVFDDAPVKRNKSETQSKRTPGRKEHKASSRGSSRSTCSRKSSVGAKTPPGTFGASARCNWRSETNSASASSVNIRSSTSSGSDVTPTDDPVDSVNDNETTDIFNSITVSPKAVLAGPDSNSDQVTVSLSLNSLESKLRDQHKRHSEAEETARKSYLAKIKHLQGAVKKNSGSGDSTNPATGTPISAKKANSVRRSTRKGDKEDVRSVTLSSGSLTNSSVTESSIPITKVTSDSRSSEPSQTVTSVPGDTGSEISADAQLRAFTNVFDAIAESYTLRLEALNRCLKSAERKAARTNCRQDGEEVERVLAGVLAKAVEVATREKERIQPVMTLMKERERVKEMVRGKKASKTSKYSISGRVNKTNLSNEESHFLRENLKDLTSQTITVLDAFGEGVPRYRGLHYCEVILLEEMSSKTGTGAAPAEKTNSESSSQKAPSLTDTAFQSLVKKVLWREVGK